MASADKAPEIRWLLKDDHLSFTEIAKCVGERWQALSPEEKEPYESHATAAKEKYNNEMVKYKTTENYKEYLQYLAEFKLKNPGPAGEGSLARICGRQFSLLNFGVVTDITTTAQIGSVRGSTPRTARKALLVHLA